jgi:hypothetical protein
VYKSCQSIDNKFQDRPRQQWFSLSYVMIVIKRDVNMNGDLFIISSSKREKIRFDLFRSTSICWITYVRMTVHGHICIMRFIWTRHVVFIVRMICWCSNNHRLLFTRNRNRTVWHINIYIHDFIDNSVR